MAESKLWLFVARHERLVRLSSATTIWKCDKTEKAMGLQSDQRLNLVYAAMTASLSRSFAQSERGARQIASSSCGASSSSCTFSDDNVTPSSLTPGLNG